MNPAGGSLAETMIKSEELFQPLLRTKVCGIGFGLSIAKMIVQKNDGDLTVESAPG